MKILRFMHAGYQTIRQDSVIIKQKSVLGIFENWRRNGKKTGGLFDMLQANI